jgi:hypothetical protein
VCADRALIVGPYLSCVTTDVTLIGNSACRIYEDFFVQESTSLSSVTTDVTLFGNKNMKKQTGL